MAFSTAFALLVSGIAPLHAQEADEAAAEAVTDDTVFESSAFEEVEAVPEAVDDAALDDVWDADDVLPQPERIVPAAVRRAKTVTKLFFIIFPPLFHII